MYHLCTTKQAEIASRVQQRALHKHMSKSNVVWASSSVSVIQKQNYLNPILQLTGTRTRSVNHSRALEEGKGYSDRYGSETRAGLPGLQLILLLPHNVKSSSVRETVGGKHEETEPLLG